MKKLLAMTLALCFVLSAAGCSKNNSTVDKASSVPVSTESKEEAVAQTPNEYGWVVPKETIKFSFYKGQQNPEELAERIKPLQAWILENFNVDIECQVFDIERGQKLNLMLAANDYPDVITGIGQQDLSRFSTMKKAVDLAPYMDTTGKDLKAGLQKWGVYETFFDAEGKMYGLPTYYGYVNEPDLCAFLRNDWWEELGKPAYETTEDYYKLLNDMLAKHPKNANGEKAYALSFSGMSTGGTPQMIRAIGGAWGLKDHYKIGADNSFTYWTNTQEGFEMIKYLNRFHRDGTLDPDAFINTYDDWRAKNITDRIMGGFDDWWKAWNGGHEYWKQEDPNWQENKRLVQIAVKAPGVEKPTMTGKSARGYGAYTIITDKAKDAESILKWINYTDTEIGRWIPAYGVPNTETSLWTFENGKPEFAEKPKNDLLTEKFDWNTQMWPTGAQSFHLSGSLEGVRGNNTSYYYDHSFTDLMPWWKVMIDNTKDSIYDATIEKMIVVDPTSDLGTKKQRIVDADIVGFAKCILSNSDEELKKNFDEHAKTVNELGAKDLEAYMTSEYARLSASQQ